MKLVLHNYWRSSSSQRVRIALGLKGLAYEYVAVNLLTREQFSDAVREKNPLAQVPVLDIVEADGTRRTLTQSLPILEYLDERFPAPPLLPADPYLRARVRALAQIVVSGIQPYQNLAVIKQIKSFGVDDRAWARAFIADGLAAYEHAAKDVAGAFSAGDAPTVADCCLIPQLHAARRFDVEVDRFAYLLQIEQRALALPAFANAAPERQPDAVKA